MLFEYAFYNAYIDNGIPDSFFISVDSQKYVIEHSNNFDSFNGISFIFLNIPINEHIQKIKIF